MEKTLVLLTTHRGLEPETGDCVRKLRCPSQIESKGVADVSLARSIGFDQALQGMKGTEIDTVLCIDDDMVFSADDAHRLCELARASGVPTSALAVTAGGLLAASPLPPGKFSALAQPRQRWLTGLAFMAIPRAALEDVAERLDALLMGNRFPVRQWCRSGEHPAFPGHWTREDHWFCCHFGGVEIAPIGVGHLKRIPLRPEDATIAQAVAFRAS